MDVLSRLISKGISEGRIGSYMVNGARSVSQLIYADDVLIFSEVNPISMKIINKVLSTFSKFASLTVNSDKSNAYYSKAAQDLHHIHEAFGFASKPLPLTYLGSVTK